MSEARALGGMGVEVPWWIVGAAIVLLLLLLVRAVKMSLAAYACGSRELVGLGLLGEGGCSIPVHNIIKHEEARRKDLA